MKVTDLKGFKNKYPILGEEYVLLREPTVGIIYSHKRAESVAELNPPLFFILSRCQGKQTFEDIFEEYMKVFGVKNKRTALEKVSLTLLTLSGEGIISFRTCPTEASPDQFRITKNFNLYSVNIEITRACNLRCRHCFNNSGNPMPDELTTREWIKVLDILKKKRVLSLTFTGEPFAREDFIEILAYAASNFDVYLMTNGTVIGDDDWFNSLSDKQIEALKKVKTFQISLDSPAPEINDKYRGRGCYQKVISALERIKEWDSFIIISSTITQENKHMIRDMERLAAKYNARLTFGALEYRGRAVSPEFKNLLLDETIKIEGLENKPVYSIPKGATTAWCNMIKGYYTIRPNGYIKPCLMPDDMFAELDPRLYNSVSIFELENKSI